MTETPDHLAERLLMEGEKTLQFFKKLAPEQWSLEIYTEGACWSVRQILAHFVAAESGFARLVKGVLAGGDGSPENFDLNAYNERKVAGLDSSTVEDLLGQYSLLRLEFAGLVRNLSPEDLAVTGRHPYLGIATMEDIIKLLYRHNQIHIREIRRTLG